MHNQTGEVKIGEFILNRTSSTLKRAKKSVKLEPLPLAFLCFLLEKKGEIVSRESLLSSVWGNRIVSDDAIRKVVKNLREALTDNAKSPQYIKTVPMKGYCLIAEVMELEQEKSTVVKHLPMKGVAAAFILLIIILITLYSNYFTLKPIPSSTEEAPTIERLTNLSGSELSADYSESNKTLVFLHRVNNTDPWQLFSKNLMSGLVHRLTWDKGNYYKALFSPNGETIVYWRVDEVSNNIYLSHFNADSGLSKTTQLNKDNISYAPLSWSVDGKVIYVTNYVMDSKIQALFKLDIKSKKTQQLTFPNTEGYGDYLAQESPDGRYLAVLRNVSDRKYLLLIIELASKKIIVKKSLSFYANALVWNATGDSFAMSSFKGDFYSYSLPDEQLIEQRGSTPGLNDAFYRCGEQCFYMRQHDMNYTDIKEIPNPFIETNQLSTVHIESNSAEFHPFYNTDGSTLYYTAKNTKKANVIRHVLGNAPEVMYSFNPRYIVTDLSINRQETLLLGKVEERIFILDLTTKELTYITSALEIVSNPTWSVRGSSIYFARVEQHKKMMLQYDLATDQLTRLSAGIIHRKELLDGRVFVVNDNNELYQLSSDNNLNFIIELPIVNSNHWHIQGDYLYFSQNGQLDFYLTRLNMKTNLQERRLMAKNSWEKGFYLHPDGQRLLITQSLLANSNIVKVTWH
ncbi:MAG: winged helix-turn-helix domain-containing protein [Colwellia sp.]|nr:winged helix-turn-helix domain-containing protein [Colwellia sp.]